VCIFESPCVPRIRQDVTTAWKTTNDSFAHRHTQTDRHLVREKGRERQGDADNDRTTSGLSAVVS